MNSREDATFVNINPDQIGESFGPAFQRNELLDPVGKIDARDEKRWELNPASGAGSDKQSKNILNKELIKKLAEFKPTEMPVLSVYLDMRPQKTGGNPGIRSGEVVLKDRLHEIEKTYLPRGENLDSFRADREKIQKFVANEMSPATSGLIIFACSAENLWEKMEIGAELENEVAVGGEPSLFQFAKLLGDYETAVGAVVKTNTARFFVTNYGKLKETDVPRRNARCIRRNGRRQRKICGNAGCRRTFAV